MLAKTGGAIFFGVANALVPVAIAVFLVDLSQAAWSAILPAVVLIAVASTFLGPFIAVAVSEVFEAQTFSNFFRFPIRYLMFIDKFAYAPFSMRQISAMVSGLNPGDLLYQAFNSGLFHCSVFVSSKHCSIAQRGPLSHTSVFSLVLDDALLKMQYIGYAGGHTNRAHRVPSS